MQITVSGNATYIQRGDIIESGGIKIVHGTERKTELKKITEKELVQNVAIIRDRIEHQRHWFCVCKYMMWGRMCPDGRFDLAVEILSKFYPEVKFNAKDLSNLNALSFQYTPDKWNRLNSPFTDLTTFNGYHYIATILYNLL